MAKPATKLPFLRHKRAKGRDYWYFDTGTKDVLGKTILTRLPALKDPSFGGSYARAVAARTSRKNKQGILTLDGLIRQFERSPEYRGRSESTQKSYALYLARANSLIRNRAGESPPVKAVERRDIVAMRNVLADTPGAANQAIRAVSALFFWAIANDKAMDNPAKGISKFDSKEHKAWPQALVDEALTDPQIGMAVALLYFTGQRIGEVVRMSWHDIEGDFMRVFVQKKQTHIRVAILPELADLLKAQPKAGVTILTNSNGQSWSSGGLRDKIQAWGKQRKVHIVPHGLRKNAVNSLFEAGCTAAEVSGITDQSLAMLEHYGRGRNKLGLGRAAVVKLDTARKARNKG